MVQPHPLKSARKARHLTARQLAELSGVSLQTIHKYENEWKVPGVHNALAIAGALELSPLDLFPPEYTPAARRMAAPAQPAPPSGAN